MRIRVITSRDIRNLISMPSAIDALTEAFVALSTGGALVPGRGEVPVAGDGIVFVMPGYLKRSQDFGLKVGLWVPSSSVMAASAPTLVLVFNSSVPGSIGIMDGRDLTDLRTGAVSGLATRVLACQEANALAVIGAGRQARTQALAVHAVRPLSTIRIYSRTRSRAESLAAWLRQELNPPAREIKVVDSPAQAVSGASVIVTATTSDLPVFDGHDLGPGTHINAVGAFRSNQREVDDWTISQAKIVVDSRVACLERAGDLVIPIRAGTLNAGTAVHAELGEILAGIKPGRRTETEITFFKSLGNAVQDTVLARMILNRAEAENMGHVVDL